MSKMFCKMRDILSDTYSCTLRISKKRTKYIVNIDLDGKNLCLIEFTTGGKVYVACRKCGQSDSIKVKKDGVFGFVCVLIKEISKRINYPWFLMNVDCDYANFENYEQWANSLCRNNGISESLLNMHEQRLMGKDMRVYDIFFSNKLGVELFRTVSHLSDLVCGG